MSLIAYDGQIELDEDDWLDADESRVPEDEEDYMFGDGCHFPGYCLVPYDHMRWECYTREMAEMWADEQQDRPA